MKPLPLLLAVSLIANAALAVVLISKRDASHSVSSSPGASGSTGSSLAAAPAVSAEAATHAAAAEALVSAAKSGDAASVRDQLRALGMPDDVVRSVIRAMVGKRMADIQKSITNAQTNGAYWRTGPGGYFNFGGMTKEQRLQLRDASRAATKQLEELMGPDPMDPGANRFAFLPPDKAAKARELERDYSDLRMQIMAETEGFRLPTDEEKIAFLEKEQRKDLAALLSPEELEAFDLRNSSTANRLRSQLRNMDISESEYKALYAAQKAFDDKVNSRAGRTPGDSPTPAGDQGQARAQAQQQLYAEMKATLGEERFNAYLRSQNGEYRTLEAAAKRFNLPQTTVDQVFSARDQTVAEAQRITNDANLNPDQRRAALSALADQIRTQVRTSLGNDIADNYLKTNMRWVDALQKGQALTVTPEGNVYAKPNQNGSASNNGTGVPMSSSAPPRR